MSDTDILQQWFYVCAGPVQSLNLKTQNVVSLPIPMGYDCAYGSACVSSSPSDLSYAGSSSSLSRIQEAPVIVDLKRHSYNNQTNV